MTKHAIDTNALFQRVQTSYDLERMRRSRIISVGCGGARSFLEEMARCGVGEFVLIDSDSVAEPNIGTQQVYVTDVGRPKVDCIAERLKLINPSVRVAVFQKAIEDIDDCQFDYMSSPWLFKSDPPHPSEHIPERYRDDSYTDFAGTRHREEEVVRPSWNSDAWYIGDGALYYEPEITLLCGMTDNFYAQARTHRLSLQFGLPSLCCQLYRFGQAGEVTFTYPGVTPACQRCILRPRYKSYLERGYKNDVTSDGAPIFATTMINALCGDLALVILHHGTDHPHWGNTLSRIGNRSLVQIRMHPDSPLQVFSRVFSGADTSRLFSVEAVWLPQEPDPRCPDCGGTGNLLDAKGTFSDTRVLRQKAG